MVDPDLNSSMQMMVMVNCTFIKTHRRTRRIPYESHMIIKGEGEISHKMFQLNPEDAPRLIPDRSL